ncbi:MAG TPA: A24 family peptidase C-terminal domain-containing protein [Methanomassiliicoccales archaeon]|nr:A24 family peptidase C-terminal domain-containing protein [Methanomassiliicoccales archaeon]
MEWLDLSRLLIAIAVLVAASYSDWRTRLASDWYWIILGCVGLGLIAYQLATSGADPLYFLFLVPLGVVFFDIFWERKGILEDGINVLPLLLYLIAALSLVYLALTFWEDLLFWQLLDILIMFGLFILLYQIDVIKGGADAKALISLSLVFPVYPVVGSFPLITVPADLAMLIFPFSLLVLFNAAIISLVVPLGLLFLNLARGDAKFPAMLLGYRVDMAEARRKFVWPMQRVENGVLKFVYFPKDDGENEKILQGLDEFGAKRIWVTPKIPFLLFITAGLMVSAIVGNPVLALIG